MFAHRSTLLVYSLELPFASFIDFFSSRYENSFEWPDGTRGLLKADERVYFSVTENPKWRPDTGTPVEWPYKGNALNSSSWNNADERKTRGNPNVSLCISNEKGGLEERSVYTYISRIEKRRNFIDRNFIPRIGRETIKKKKRRKKVAIFERIHHPE